PRLPPTPTPLPARRSSDLVPTTTQQQDLDRYREAFEPLRRAVFIGAPIVAAFFAGSTATAQWQSALLALHGESWGTSDPQFGIRSEEHTSELQSRFDLVCR